MRTFLVVAAAALLGGCAQRGAGTPPADPAGEGAVAGEAVCAALVEYDGHTYDGHDVLRREPATTGRVGTGTAPGCDDGGGSTGARTVEVAELAGLPMTRAVLVDGTLYVRSDRPFPESARAWFRSPACDASEPFRLRGDWLGVQGSHPPRFDGDLRPPYRVELHVTDGPLDYLGATVQVRATEDTRPGLGPEDVGASLGQGGGLVARVRCEEGPFLATALTSTPG